MPKFRRNLYNSNSSAQHQAAQHSSAKFRVKPPTATLAPKMGLKRARAPKPLLVRHRPGKKSSRLALVPRCGVVAMLAAVLLIVFEFWVMHHHNPEPHSKHHTSRVPGMSPLRNDTKRPGQRPEVLNSMVEPDIGARQDSAVAGTQTLAPQEELKDAESVNGGPVGFEPPKPPLVPSELKDDASPDSPASEDGGGEGEEDEYGGMRVAVLVPYSGPGLPLWFDAFTELAAASAAAVDWIIFCEEVRVRMICSKTQRKLLAPCRLCCLYLI